MNKAYINIIAAASIVAFASCSSQPKEAPTTEEVEESSPVVESIDPTPAVCIWNKLALRETAHPKGKYLTAISVGETLEYLGQDSVTEKRTYASVRLNDGKEGWVLKDFLAIDAKPGTATEDFNIYSRPDLLTKTDKKFLKMDIIASIETEGEWMKIKGRRTGADWMDEGWVKSQNISFEAVDIATAKFAKEALAKDSEEDKMTAIQELLDNTDLSSSIFMEELRSLTTKPEIEEELEEIESTIESDPSEYEEVLEAVSDSIGG